MVREGNGSRNYCNTGQSSFHALTLQSNAKLEKVEQQRSDETDVVTDKNLAFG